MERSDNLLELNWWGENKVRLVSCDSNWKGGQQNLLGNLDLTRRHTVKGNDQGKAMLLRQVKPISYLKNVISPHEMDKKQESRTI